MKKQQLDLFDNPVEDKMTDLLLIKTKVKRQNKLSKEQKKFNNYIRKIENLSKEVGERETILDDLLIKYSQEIKPIKVKIAESLLEFAFNIHHLLQNYSYTSNQRSHLGGLIIHFMDTAFFEVEPDEAAKAIYDKYSQQGSYDELVEEGYEAEIDDFIEMIEFQFGVSIDRDELPDLKTASAEELHQYLDSLKDRIEAEQHKKQKIKEKAGRKKAAKQKDSVQEEKAADEMKKKSLRALYLSLAKVLHPDSGGTEEELHLKGELMKKVTVAYKNMDLATLLKLEIQWLKKENESLDIKADEQLKVYNEVLQEQVRQLEAEIYLRFSNPRYRDIKDYCHAPVKQISNMFQEELEDVEIRLNDIRYDLNIVTNKKASLQFLKEINQSIASSRFDVFF